MVCRLILTEADQSQLVQATLDGASPTIVIAFDCKQQQQQRS